ncbi:GNAT family N-acetyltransferase [Terrarubrum flagellatum]|uniref:GNAT family N-acetyltransferase n=1 Tax=Terrirubrum flagellatum TaxID=2895980 RepID=UPI003144FC59
MTTDIAAARAIEERMLNAWPSVETLVAGDWLLRFANGYSKRSNSATTLREGGDMDDAMIDHVAARANLWGIPAIVRISPLCASTLEARLTARDFQEIEPTFGMMREIGDAAAGDARVELPAAPDADWITANASSYGGVKSDATKLRAILERIRPQAAFATFIENGVRVAWGIGVIERGMIGLQDIVVSPDLRGRGVGRALVASLMAWGRENGARHAYLHVLETNEGARKLYRNLGFSDVYTIRHRVLARA